ncbi:DMT family transporter [Pollutimonas harenae]|uniref:EamA family transporter n=1 Tax=Pollutimonas harenae TaxID=657015 RepID=A0A853GUT1_9BURK|nr:DMT family transporter [Pollutimonas harenae]NYT86041.1 EamA family transporter [Pollutimonas harenae]TEA71089.1 multidrug DMT transporter permease [Pollutimonas harenae]
MTPEIFGLVICAAALHASWNLISKKANASAGHFVFAYRLISAVLYAPWVIYILWADGMSWSLQAVFFIALSSLLHLGYSLCLQWGYHAADLSIVYPMARGTGPLLSSLAAFLWLGEQPSTLGILGIFSIVAGILLIASDGNLRRFTSPKAWTGVRWGLFIGLFIAAYTVADAYSVKVLLIAPVILDWLSALGNAMILAPRAWMRRTSMLEQMRGKWGYALAVGALSPMAYILVLFALQKGGPVSLVAPLREMSLMMATVAGFFILKERASTARLLGCAVIVAGVVLLTR